jgi:hypothetical protein
MMGMGYIKLNCYNVDAIDDRNRVPFQTDQDAKKIWHYDLYSKEVSLKVGLDRSSFRNRYDYWEKIVNASTQGGNPYENINSALGKLGFTVSPGSSYEQKFGMVLSPPGPLAILKTNHLQTL